MGTWGPGPLENDDAQAFAIESRKSFDLVKCMVAAFCEVAQNGDDYLEAPSAQAAIAAAEMLTIALNDADTEDGIDAELVNLARRSLERALNPPSEILELWQESNDFDKWKNSVESIVNRLKNYLG